MPDSSWTETGSSISLIPTTTPIDPGSSPANANYLTNAYKAALMQQYAGELAMKTSLDSLATTWGCSATAYNNAVAAINTTITGFSGAPANWATIWPDGTMSGPWLGVQTLLSSNWSAIATQRTALQSVISNAQAAAAQTAAIAAAAADATTKMNAAVATAQNLAPVVVSSLPTLPSSSYPAGRLAWNTTDGQLYRSTGSTWTVLTVAAADISGTLAAAQIASLAASQVTGQLTDSQLAAISAAKMTGQITSTQISNGAISTPQLAAGAVTATTIAADTITASQIAAGAITASELAAGAVVAGKIAAGTIQAGDIAAATITGDRIAANTITTTQIAANTITAADIAANTITAGCIAAGAIGAAQIAAGAITTAALTVCDWTNLCYNPGFETGTNAQWDRGSVSAAYANTGSYSLKLPNGGGTYAVRNLNCIPVVAGQVYLVQCWVYITAALSSGGVYVRIRGLNASGVEVWTGESSTTSTPVGAWTQISTTQTVPAQTVPAGVVAANLEIVSSSPVGGDIYVDDCYYRRCDDSSLIVDGSITASKIAAGAITASMITAGSLTANVIYFSDGFCLNTLEPKESGANVTSGHILTTTSKPSNTVTVTGMPTVIIGGFAFSVNAASTSDVYNIFGRIAGRQTAGSTGADCYIDLYVDGVSKTSQDCYFAGGLNTDGMCAFYMSITGITAGAHTFQFYAHSGASGTSWTIWNTSTALCQRIF